MYLFHPTRYDLDDTPGRRCGMTDERAPKSLAEESSRDLSFHVFLNSLRASGLFDDEQLSPLIEKYLREAGRNPRGDAFARMLLAAGLLTPWQLERLSGGENRSFLIGGYRLLCYLGRGGMGVVYLAEHPRMGRRVAIKVLTRELLSQPTVLERFSREARALAALDHPNIVRAYDINQEGNVHYLVLEYVDGSDLEKLVKEQGPMPCEIAADFIAQAASGLAHAHEHGFVHRDVKPANLMIHSNGLVKILDLGLARFSQVGQGNVGRFELLGTPQFMSPEQARDPNQVDGRSDIYSLGCVFHYLLTAQFPFTGRNISEIIMGHMVREPAPIESVRGDVPPPVREICAKMMAKQPQDRYQRAEEVAEALQAWLKHRRGAGAKTAAGSVDLAGAAPEIMVVDDDPSVRRLLEVALRKAGYRVTLAADGAEALEKLHEGVAVCLLDLDMPRIDGMEALREFRARQPDTAVIMVSAANRLQSAVAAMREGAFDYFAKPCDIAHVLLRIEEALTAFRRRKAAGNALEAVMQAWYGGEQPIFGAPPPAGGSGSVSG